MTRAEALLRQCRRDGVELQPEGDAIRVNGPSELLTAVLYQQILHFKEELLQLLESEEERAPIPDPGAASQVRLADASAIEASFLDGSRVQIRKVTPSRHEIWPWCGHQWRRRSDSASPSVYSAMRTAEHWYGPPLDGWHAIERSRL